jgi:hypothetical protein
MSLERNIEQISHTISYHKKAEEEPPLTASRHHTFMP